MTVLDGLMTVERVAVLQRVGLLSAVPGHRLDRPTLRSLLRHRYIVLIVSFQMLSAVESQWLDYLVFDQAGRRYTDSTELAVFVSRFMAIAYGADIIVLLIVAGAVMSRCGLRVGLAANPAGVLLVIVAMVAATSLQGSSRSCSYSSLAPGSRTWC